MWGDRQALGHLELPLMAACRVPTGDDWQLSSVEIRIPITENQRVFATSGCMSSNQIRGSFDISLIV